MADTQAAPAAATSAPSTDPILLHARAMNTLVRLQRELLKQQPDYDKVRRELNTAKETISELAAAEKLAAQEAQGDTERIALLFDCNLTRADLLGDVMNLFARRNPDVVAQVAAKTAAPTAH